MSKFKKLEKLIREYEKAINSRDHKNIDRLATEVELEADRVDYTNHQRLMALHTMAEQA